MEPDRLKTMVIIGIIIVLVFGLLSEFRGWILSGVVLFAGIKFVQFLFWRGSNE